jgi:S1-C subfamily serine protease
MARSSREDRDQRVADLRRRERIARHLEIRPGSPAEKAGLTKGDVLEQIGGKEVSEQGLLEVLAGYKPGESAEVMILRGKERKTVRVTFAETKQ